MSKIVELSEALANQIAAGEVVERPASVVKELVENSIDAGSNQIKVRVEESGLKRIEVIDNGGGIEAEDVERAFLRHATSKIKSKEDLFRIRTLGFRGEALPSIASVSNLTIETASLSEKVGTKVVIQGGKRQKRETIAQRRGTKIRVEQLFYNTPARLKHIKSLQAELAHIVDVLNRLSLAHPDISIALANEKHTLLQTTGTGDLKEAIARIYGLSAMKKMVDLHAEDLDFTVKGYASLPELTRASRKYMTLLLNGRFIKNFALNRAIIEGYGTKLMVGRFPVVVLDIQIDPYLVDVNVHPTKQEVRLSKEKELVKLISTAIAHALYEEQLIPAALENLSQTQERVSLSGVEPSSENQIHEPNRNYQLRDQGKLSQTVLFEGTDEIAENLSNLTENGEANRKVFPNLEYLGQHHGTYLLCQAEDGLYLIDQHAAQERVNYEYYRDKIGQVSYNQQTLLVPLIIELSSADFLRVTEKLELLKEVGIFPKVYGESAFALREHPVWMQEAEIEESVYAFIDLILASKEVSVKKYREELAIMISCKSAIKANHRLDRESAKSLISQLSHCQNPYNCPHGRPTLVKFTNTDVEKMFRRIQASHDSAKLSALEN